MRRIRILHLGDIHYPDWVQSRSDIDLKDSELPAITSAISAHPITRVLRALTSRISDEYFDFIVQVGDLTTQGDISYIETALRHLSYIVNSANRNEKSVRCALVPGNHDINRELAAKVGIGGKFAPILDALPKYGWPSFSIDSIATHPVPADASNVSMVLLNTCIGCGEKRFLPSTISAAVVRSVNKALKAKNVNKRRVSKALSEYYETLDTPALHSMALTDLERHLGQLARDQLPIVVSHHNILPQGQPRVALYGELINAGRLRRTLLSADRPIIFLHGHIHSDPIEIIRDPRASNSLIISISAPELKNGFCELIISIDDNMRPRCCRVVQHKFTMESGMIQQKPVDIFLMPAAMPWHPDIAKAIQMELWKNRRVLWFRLRENIAQKRKGEQDIYRKLDSTVQELYFSQKLTVENPEAEPSQWTLAL